jgi:DNA repair protein RecN (Recombination protein N)
MLEELHIKNFAIIDQLELTFADGFNVITGETGAGKSIIIDAVEMLLGSKADGGWVRSGEEKAIIEGVFVMQPSTEAAVTMVLEREELPQENNAVTLMREIRVTGRTSARVNGVTVSLDVLREIGELLVDVHGQSEHLSLLKPMTHVDLLDSYAGLLELRDAMGTLVARVTDVRREMRQLQQDEASIKRRADLLRHEIEEIESAQLQPGEEDELRAERTRLTNSEQLATMTNEAVVLLHGDDEVSGAVDQLMQVAAMLSKLAVIDPELKTAYDLSEDLSAQVEELALEVRRYGEAVEFNPERLNEVEERLEFITKLRRRYGATIEAVLEHAERARAELNGIEHSEERLIELRQQETKLLKQIGELGERMSRARASAGKQLGQRVVQELADLRMGKTQFEVAMEYVEDAENGCFVGDRRFAFDASGIDELQFMMSANPGEPLRPLAKVASGGETARIMLALKRVLSQADQTPTLIFDEIDQGIGGRVGNVVGEKLWSLAGNHQVLVVTHLAQLAGYADKHYRVNKFVDAGRSRTQVLPLGDDERVSELAEMLGTAGESGKQSAREILTEAAQYKQAGNGKGVSSAQPSQKTLL